jgi:hypothetical protein
MAVRQGAADSKALGNGEKLLAFEGAPNQFDGRFGEMRDVSKGFMFDLVPVTIGSAEEMSPVDLALITALCGGYVNTTMSGWHCLFIRL